eukprot:5030542-Pyramimonas_sp.AAC.1
MAASPSTVARAGPVWCSPTTRLHAMPTVRSLWARTCSHARPPVLRAGWSTPSATSAAKMASPVSSSTTPLCPLQKQPCL